MPAVATDYLNRVWVADRDFSGGGGSNLDVIRCQTRAAGSANWTDFQVCSSPMGNANSTIHKISPPAIVACLNDTGGQNRSAAYIVFTVYNQHLLGIDSSTTIMVKVNTQGVVYVDTLSVATNLGDSFPSLALHPVGSLGSQGYGLNVAWQRSSEVYVKKTTNQDQPQFLDKRYWSSNYNLSSNPMNPRHPQIAANADTVLVAWVQGDSGAIVTQGQDPGSNYDAWDNPVYLTGCPDTVCDYPSIALGDSNIVTWQKKLSGRQL